MHGLRATPRRLAGVVCAGLVAGGVLAGALLAFSSSCTTFDGLSAAPPARPEAGPGPAGYLSTAEAVRACSRVFACPKLARSLIESISVPIDSSNFALCVDWLAGPVDPARIGFPTQAAVLKCVAQSTSCAEAGQCVALEYAELDDPRCQDAGVPEGGAADWTEACVEEGTALAYCGSTYYDNLIVHCDNAYYDTRSKCLAGKDGMLACALDETCPPATCEGTFFLDLCSSYTKLHMRWNCSATGHTCGQDDAGSIGCISGSGFDECNLYAVKCADTRVKVCDGVYQSYFDCAVLGGTCVEDGAMAHCSRPGVGCNPADYSTIVCQGNTIQLCVGGAPVAFDCASIGLTCKPGQVPVTPSCG